MAVRANRLVAIETPTCCTARSRCFRRHPWGDGGSEPWRGAPCCSPSACCWYPRHASTRNGGDWPPCGHASHACAFHALQSSPSSTWPMTSFLVNRCVGGCGPRGGGRTRDLLFPKQTRFLCATRG